ELNLPNYVVAKLKKGVRKKESGPYYLYYWQPKRVLRQAGFRSVPLGRDLGRAIEKAKSLNEAVKIWRNGGDPDPASPPKLRGTIPYLIDLYQDSEDYRDKAPKTRIGYDRCLEILHRWSARAGHPQVATVIRRGLRELHKSLRWPEGEPCGHAEGCPPDKLCRVGRTSPCPIEQLPNANAEMCVASILLGVALDEGLVTVNLAKGLKLPGAEGREQVWPDDAIEAFCAPRSQWADAQWPLPFGWVRILANERVTSSECIGGSAGGM